MSTRIDAYAEAAVALGKADGTLAVIEDELFQLGTAVENSQELQTTLADPHLPVERRQQIVQDLLAGQATPATVAIASLLVGAGLSAEITRVAAKVGERSAAGEGLTVAEVRSAVALTEEQKDRLAAALAERLGRQVAVRNVVDPNVVGGVVTTIGDSVLDGTVRARLNQLRAAF